jgi:hypothetical protein
MIAALTLGDCRRREVGQDHLQCENQRRLENGSSSRKDPAQTPSTQKNRVVFRGPLLAETTKNHPLCRNAAPGSATFLLREIHNDVVRGPGAQGSIGRAVNGIADEMDRAIAKDKVNAARVVTAESSVS